MKKIAVILSFVLLSACSEPPEAPTAPVSVNPQHEIATQWVTAATTSKTAMMDMIKTHMAESGVIHRNRYVGFGFQFDPDRSDGMVVQRVIPGSPAEGVLQVGDRFLSVRDVEVSEATMDQLDFRGKPGELVEATIQRGDETLTVAIQRGIVSAPSSKTEFLRNMASANEIAGIRSSGFGLLGSSGSGSNRPGLKLVGRSDASVGVSLSSRPFK